MRFLREVELLIREIGRGRVGSGTVSAAAYIVVVAVTGISSSGAFLTVCSRVAEILRAFSLPRSVFHPTSLPFLQTDPTLQLNSP